MRDDFVVRSVLVAAVAALALAGCGATRPQPPDGGPPNPGITPAQQCQLLQTGVNTAELGLAFVKTKDPVLLDALESGMTGVRVASADYCDAVGRGESVDGLNLFLTAFNASLADFNAKMRAARAAVRVSFNQVLGAYELASIPKDDPPI